MNPESANEYKPYVFLPCLDRGNGYLFILGGFCTPSQLQKLMKTPAFEVYRNMELSHDVIGAEELLAEWEDLILSLLTEWGEVARFHIARNAQGGDTPLWKNGYVFGEVFPLSRIGRAVGLGAAPASGSLHVPVPIG